MKDQNKLDLIYVVGFPKSGNTWLTRLLADALDGYAGAPLTVGDDNKEIASDVNIDVRQRGVDPKYKIIKSHLAPPQLFKKIDSNVKRIVYIKRDFRDVVVSAFFHHEKIDEKFVRLQTLKELKKNGVSMFTYLKKRRRLWLHILRLCKQWSDGVGSWPNHIDEYQNLSDTNIKIFYTVYRRLIADPQTELKSIIKTLDIEMPDDDKIITAVKNQSFEKKREFFEKLNNDENIPLGKEFNQRFLRKGIVGDYKRFLSKKMQLYIKLIIGDKLSEFDQ